MTLSEETAETGAEAAHPILPPHLRRSVAVAVGLEVPAMDPTEGLDCMALVVVAGPPLHRTTVEAMLEWGAAVVVADSDLERQERPIPAAVAEDFPLVAAVL